MKRVSFLLLPLLVLLWPAPSHGQGESRAGLVVKFSDGNIRTSCVSFTGESITGLALLEQSGLEVIAQPAGNTAAVCKIGPDGCDYPAEPCFCKFGVGQQGQYWAYWKLNAGAWQYSVQGAGSSPVRNGSVDGWAWGTGSVQSGAAPPVKTFEQICPVAEQAPPKPTAKPTPKPTARPTVRPTPKPTARPTNQPTAAVIAAAPTATIPPSATITIVPTTIAVPPTATILPSATTAPTQPAPPTVLPVTPTSKAAGAAQSQPDQPQIVNYAVFGMMLAAIVGAIRLALRRRR